MLRTRISSLLATYDLTIKYQEIPYLGGPRVYSKVLELTLPCSQHIILDRAAAASKVRQKDIPLDVILATVGWGSECTFGKFYDKPIIDTSDMGTALLVS